MVYRTAWQAAGRGFGLVAAKPAAVHMSVIPTDSVVIVVIAPWAYGLSYSRMGVWLVI